MGILRWGLRFVLPPNIQVLSGLEPVRRRPGMYTDTSRPNHLAQEVVDNSVDEALAGHAQEIEVTLPQSGEFATLTKGAPVQIGWSGDQTACFARRG